MAAKPLGSFCLVLGLATLLAACGERELARRESKRVETPAPAEPAATGIYKVGQPYQVKKIWYYPRVDYSYDETGIASWYGPGFHGKLTANGEIFDQSKVSAAHRTLPMPSIVRVTNLENGRSIKVRVNDRGPFAHGRIIDLSKRAAELLDFRRKGTAKVRVQILEAESQQLADKPKAPKGEVDRPEAAPVETVAVQQLPPVGGVVQAEPQEEPLQMAVSATELTANSPVVDGVELDEKITKQAVRKTRVYVQAGAFTEIANAERLRARLSGLGSVHIVRAVVGDTRFYRVRLGPMRTVDQADKTLDLLLYNGVNNAKVVVE